MADAEGTNVRLPAAQAAQVRRIVAAGGAESVSAYVADAVQSKLDRDQSLSELKELFDRTGQKPSAEHLAWAREVLGVEEDEGHR
ncbi:MAG: hypothetical protein ACRDXX_11530 [Stackebrandtia sp.]